MKPWPVEETRRSILRLYGREQLERVRPCLQSLVDRQYYASFHYTRAHATLARYVKANLHDKPFPLALRTGGEEWRRFNVFIRKLGSDLTACVQSLHSLPDILASAVYLSLCLGRAAAPGRGQYISHSFVLRSLQSDSRFRDICTTLRRATAGRTFMHLAALANRSKHYSIVFPALNADLTGRRAKQYLVVFPEFSHRERLYPRAFVNDLLPQVYEQLSESVVQTGHALNDYLQALVETGRAA